MTNSFVFDADHLVVNEVFGPTLQGEGPLVGTPSIFLRLAMCNQRCIFCDTKYTWDWKHYDIRKEAARSPVGIVAGFIEQLIPESKSVFPNLVITGGEPMLQQEALARLIAQIEFRFDHIEIETAGTVELLPELKQRMNLAGASFNVSPKLANSGNSIQRRRHGLALNKLASYIECNQGCFKFVVTGPDDLEEIEWLVNEYNLPNVYLMPEGTDREVLQARMQYVAEAAIKHGWFVSPRLHVEIWGNRRGV